ncbi:MAG: hypothetical protein AAGF82_13700 [Pseudomonadota bacterium]
MAHLVRRTARDLCKHLGQFGYQKMLTFQPRLSFQFLPVLLGFLAVITNLVTLPAEAEDKLETAIELWLQDDDERAIPMLADLAASGNHDAALILGQLEKRSVALSPYLAKLPLNERIALLKAPGGGSGVSWLEVVADSSELAAALLMSHDPYTVAEGITELLEQGEEGPATERYWNNRFSGFPELAAERHFVGGLPKSIRHHAWFAALDESFSASLSTSQRKLLIADYTGALKKQDLQALITLRSYYHRLVPEAQLFLKTFFEIADTVRIFAHEPQYWKEVDATPKAGYAHGVLQQSENLQRLSGICQQHCTGEIEQCVRSLYYGIKGFEGFSRLQTPVERLVPSKVYFESKRHTADILRASYPRFSGIFKSKFKFAKHRFEKELFGVCIVDEILASSSTLKIADE